jgi:hypothetical protein
MTDAEKAWQMFQANAHAIAALAALLPLRDRAHLAAHLADCADDSHNQPFYSESLRHLSARIARVVVNPDGTIET